MTHPLHRRGALGLAFASVVTSAAAQGSRGSDGPPQGGERRGPPFDKIAQDLGIPADRVRAAFEQVGPPPRSQNGPPSEQQLTQHAQQLAAAMKVSVDKLRPVLDKYRPSGPAQRQQ